MSSEALYASRIGRPSQPPAGRRERTRARLSEVAVELFAAQGYDETTTAAISAAAGVTERTFFNHFETKIDALFPRDEYTSFAVIHRRVAEDRSGRSDLDVLCEHGARWIAVDLDLDPRWQHRMGRLRLKISETSATVRGMRATAQTQLRNAMLDGLVQRSGSEVATTAQSVAATIVSATIHRAFVAWVESDDVQGFSRILEEHIETLRSLSVSHPPTTR